jgi:hypothetical protein
VTPSGSHLAPLQGKKPIATRTSLIDEHCTPLNQEGEYLLMCWTWLYHRYYGLPTQDIGNRLCASIFIKPYCRPIYCRMLGTPDHFSLFYLHAHSCNPLPLRLPLPPQAAKQLWVHGTSAGFSSGLGSIVPYTLYIYSRSSDHFVVLHSIWRSH